MTTTALAQSHTLPDATRRTCALLLVVDILLSLALILLGVLTSTRLLRVITISAGTLFPISFTPLWLALLFRRSWSIIPMAICSAFRGLVATIGLWLVLTDRRLGAGIGLLAYAELLLALLAVPVLLTAVEHRDTPA